MNGYFCSNYALICVDGRRGVILPPASQAVLIGDSGGEETFCVQSKQLRWDEK